jgi:hypothetical protein
VTRNRIWTRRSFFDVLRVAACLLLLAIAADLGADGLCDEAPVAAVAGVALLGAGVTQPGSPEACAAFCVPDCFCCSASVPATPAVEPAEPRPLAASVVPPLERWPTGVRPVVDRPPLRLA